MTETPQSPLKLMQELNTILPQHLEMIIFALSPPSGVIPFLSATQGARVSALLNWTCSPAGCGLIEVQQILDEMINSSPKIKIKTKNVYIEQASIEQQCYQEIIKNGALIRIKAPQKMGKTWLMNRIFDYAVTQQSYKTVFFDLLEPEEEVISDLDQFLRYFCSAVSWRLGLTDEVDEFWQQQRSKTLKCRTYFEKEILSNIDTNLVLGLDNVDRKYGLNWQTEQVQQLMTLVEGHPYLVHEAINYLATYTATSLKEFIQKASTDEGIYFSHFQSFWAILENDQELTQILKEIVFSDSPISVAPKLSYKLESMGLIMLNFLIEQRGITQADLIGIIGTEEVVAEVVAGKSEISKTQAKALGEFFKVDTELFIAQIQL